MVEAPVALAVPLLLVLLAGLAWGAASLDGVLAARAAGRPTRSGLVVPVAETARLLVQRRRTTLAPDALLWRVGGGTLLVAALLMAGVVPLGDRVLADSGVGIVWSNAADVLAWVAFWTVGWGTNSTWGLVGGYRFLAQAVSYELPLMFALTAPAVAAGSLRVGDVVAAQSGLWFVVWLPVAFVVHLGAVLAFSAAGPFAEPVGTDAAGGLLAESSGVDRLVLQAGRVALLAAGAATSAALFLGGGSGPGLPGWAWSLMKTAAVLALLVWARRRVAAVRADRFAEIGWLVALPATLLQLLVVAVVVAARA